jgi:hypothetical protein
VTEFRYLQNRNGKKVVADFRRLLETGDIAKLTPGLYHELSMHGGFIAHFGLHGFRATFDGRLSKLLDGECHPLAVEGRSGHFDWPALEESGYKDGMSAGEVIREIAAVARELEVTVREREAEVERAKRVRLMEQIAQQEGYTVTAVKS